jgi:hypothetical protein
VQENAGEGMNILLIVSGLIVGILIRIQLGWKACILKYTQCLKAGSMVIEAVNIADGQGKAIVSAEFNLIDKSAIDTITAAERIVDSE